MVRKEYSDIAVQTTLVGDLAIGGLSLTVASAAGYPSGTYHFVIKIDDELIACSGRAGTTLTVDSAGRGFSNTTAIAHVNGAVVNHVWEANSATDFARHVYDTTNDDHAQYQKESEKDQNDGYAGLDSSGVVPDTRIAATIARDTEVTAAITTHSAAPDPHGDRAFTTAAVATHELDTTNVHGIADTTLIWEAGDIKASAKAAPSAGWLLCDGAAVSRTTYGALFAAIGTTYGAGDASSTFNVPDYRGRTIVGAGAGPGLSARARGATGGEEAHTLTGTESGVAAHTHTQDAHSHTQNPHSHTITDPGHGHLISTTAVSGGLTQSGIAGVVSPTGTMGTSSNATGINGTNAATAVGQNATATNQAAVATNAVDAHNVMQPFSVANVFIKT